MCGGIMVITLRPPGICIRVDTKSFPVEDDAYFLTLCRYVEANPLRAGIVKRAQDWQGSSLHQRGSTRQRSRN